MGAACSTVAACALGVCLVTTWRRWTALTPVDRLKNALLSFAILQVGDLSDDGTKLPMFSGSSLVNACFTYIVDRRDQ
jgi:hypothetical protein